MASSRNYAADIISALPDASRTRKVNSYLADMRVKGNLLRPILDLQRQHAGLQVQRTAWTESAPPGELNLRATVVLLPGDGSNIVHTYKLVAMFRGTEQGTVLERLDLRPE